MAYIVDYSLNGVNGASTAVNLTIPSHVADDVIFIFITQDANTAITLNTTGYTQIGSQTNGGSGLTSSAYYKKATGSNETANITTTDAWCAYVFVIRDVDPTTQVDGTPSFTGVSTAASQFSSSSITTTSNDSLVMYLVGLDGVATAGHTDPGVMFLNSFDNGGTTSTTAACAASAWYVQRVAGATPVAKWTCSASVSTTRLTIAWKNKSGGRIPPYIDDQNGVGEVITPCHHFSTLNGISFPTALSLTDIGPNGTGKATVYDAAAATADFGINPYSAALSTTPAATASSSVSGFQIDFSTAKDLSSGFVVGTVIASTPRIANYVHGSVSEGGSFVAFADANNFYRSYQVLAKDSNPNTEGRAVFSVKVGQSSTQYGYSSSALNSAAVNKMLFLSNCPTGTITLYISELHKALTQIIAGGDSNNPVDTEGMAAIGSSFRVKVIQRIGAAGLLSYVPIQIGGGDPVNFQIDAGALMFPRIYNTTRKEINYHGDPNAIGISYAGKSGDVIKHTNSVVTSPSPYYWEIHPNATSGATWDFKGLTIVGANVTLRNVTTFNGMTFSSCLSINASGCSLTNCTISKVPSSSNSFTVTSTSSISNSNIDVTGVSSGNYWCSVGNPSIFSNCTFTGSSTSGHALRLTTTGSYSISGLVFNGFGSDGTNSAAIFNDSGGSITLTILSGGSTPTVRNGAGASTTIVSGAVNVSVAVKNTSNQAIQNARVLLKAASGGPFPFEATVTITRSGSTATVTHTSHGMSTNDKVLIKGADQQEYNGVFTITKIDNNSYSYTVSGTPASPATGTIKATFVCLSGLTDINGQISMSRVFPSNQPVSGWARKSSSSPYYKEGVISGTVDSSLGFSSTVVLIPDE